MLWTEEEDRKLRAFWESGMTSGEIVKYMKWRSKDGILKRARALGLPKRWSHKTLDERSSSVFHNRSNIADEHLRNIEMMRVGSETMEMVLKGKMEAPYGLVWNTGSGGWSGALDPDFSYQEEIVERVDRDPCPRCGSKRGTCNHTTTGRLVTA